MTLPRLALIGMGRMGQELLRLAEAGSWPVVATIGRPDGGKQPLTREQLRDAQVAIEFTTPQAAAGNVRACVRAGVPVVVGTTGWQSEIGAVASEVLSAGGAMLHAANFSLGVNMLWQLAERAAALGRHAGFAPHITETHHAAKRDAPSGTALELQRIASQAMGATVPVTSIRVGSVPGTHELILDGAYEQLRLTHEARDRRVFAEGALVAARWLVGRVGVFTMGDVLAEASGEKS
jgi:4-hydroxy-tetrahydrodipicolinate reductase